jgi:hypothetical protein
MQTFQKSHENGVGEWLLLNVKGAILVSYIMARTSHISIAALYSTNTLIWILIVPAHWNNSSRLWMLLPGHIPIPSQPVFSVTLTFNRETSNDNFIAFGLTRMELEPTIYCTCVEHAYHYNHWQTLSHKVISSTHRHERDSNSQL